MQLIANSVTDGSDPPAPMNVHHDGGYTLVQGHLTLSLLNSNMKSLLNSELKAFVKL